MRSCVYRTPKLACKAGISVRESRGEVNSVVWTVSGIRILWHGLAGMHAGAVPFAVSLGASMLVRHKSRIASGGCLAVADAGAAAGAAEAAAPPNSLRVSAV